MSYVCGSSVVVVGAALLEITCVVEVVVVVGLDVIVDSGTSFSSGS